MEESVDVKALRAKFHNQAGMAALGGGGRPRHLLPGVGSPGTPMASNPPVNGAVRPKMSPVGPKPLPGARSVPDMPRFPRPPLTDPGGPGPARNLAPLGVFPRPPPSHRVGTQENKMAVPVTEKPGRVKATGERLVNSMLKNPVQDGPVPKQASPVTAPLRSQRSMTEVPPLRKKLPPEGPKPLKPKRPPHVNLDSLKKTPRFTPMPKHPTPGKTNGGSGPSLPGSGSPSAPPRLPAKLLIPQRSTVLDEDDQDTYDDIDALPPPPPPPPKYPGSREDSWTDQGSTQGDEESGDSELYEPIDEPGETHNPISPDKKKKHPNKQLELKNKEQRMKEKKETEYRKRFKLTGPVEPLHIARVRHDWHGGKNDLSVRQGDTIEIVRVKNNPEGKWLARTLNGTYGYISNTCVDMDYEEVKRSFLCKAADAALPPPPPPPPIQDDDFYDDVGSSQQLNSSTDLDSEEVYDDVLQLPDEFPPPPPEASLDPKKVKKLEKEEKEFRKKFKFEGPITVLWNMMVDPNASIKKGSGKDLSINRGEILDVIQLTNEKKALCRNQQGKYGYVPRSILLQAEGDDYDDVDNVAVVYDNDSSTDKKPWA